MTSVPFCPKCKAALRERTYDEIVEELMNQGMTRHQANIAFIPRTGGMVRWWCEDCEKEWSRYALMSQYVSIKPLDAGE